MTTTTPSVLNEKTSFIPPLKEVRSALRDTQLLLKLRWRFVRNTKSKIYILLGGLIFLGAIFLASEVGTLIRTYAEQGVSTAAGQFAVNYIIALNRGELGSIGAAAVGSVIIAAMFTPFTGSSMQSLAPTADLAGLRPTRIHRYFDSIITNAVSAIGFLQLIALTGIGSLLTIDGGRTGGLLFIWSVWPAILLLSVCTGWAIELISRKYGQTVRRAIAAVLATGIGIAVLLDPNHGKTIFGIGNQITNTLSAASHNDTSIVIRNLAIIYGLSLIFFLTGLFLCRIALSHPATIISPKQTTQRKLFLSDKPNFVLAQLLIAQIIRNPEVRRPLLTVLFIGFPAVWFSTQANIMSTLVVAIPLAVALAFGINIFGILGPGMTWLASQPYLMKKILIFSIAVELFTTLLLSVLVWIPSTVAGRVDLGDVAAVAGGTLVSTFMTTRSAAHKAVNKPFLVRMGTRGDMIVPPLTAINYTIRFALWSGQLGVLVMTQDGWIQAALVTAAITLSLFRMWQLIRQWNDREIQAYVIKQVSAA